MDVFELFPFLRRAPETETPADTLPVITERLNGGSGDPVQVSAAVEQLLEARSRWTVHKQSLDLHLQKLVADSADEKKRRSVRDAIARASEEINLLEIGEAPLKQRLIKAQADANRNRQYRDQDVLAKESMEIIEAIRPIADRAGEIVKRAERGELDIDPRVGIMVLPLLQFFAQWTAERRPDFDAALATLARQSAVRSRKEPSVPRKQLADGELPPWWNPYDPTYSSPISQVLRRNSIKPVVLRANPDSPPRAQPVPDDMAPLLADQVRAKVLRSGYSPADDRPQCHFGQIIRLPRRLAEHGENLGILEILEVAATPSQGDTK